MMNYNSTIHIEEWVDQENQVHKFYEPIYPVEAARGDYPGPSPVKEDKTTIEQNEAETPFVELPY
jgi:hypothetical protein